jgi:hypothetical protein
VATTLTYTAHDICTAALQEAGVSDIDAPIQAAEMRVALTRLNMMLKAGQFRAVYVWKQTTGTIAVTADTASYTITARPVSIETIAYNTGSRETPLLSMSREEYNELPVKTSSGTPSSYYLHREREQSTLYVWPVLSSATGSLDWYGRAEVDDISEPTDAVDVPGEWYEAVVYNLAMRLCSAFKTPATPELAMIARSSLADAEGADRPDTIQFMGGR